jgi:shikimate dehydrogenase
MKCYGLIGYPLGHSFSKKYFTEKFAKEGIADCCYENFSIPAIEALKTVLAQHPQLCGLNITIPYKQAVLSFLDDTTKLPEGLHACNCIKITGGKLIGYNTDVAGFERSLLQKLKMHHTRALILGNGGAAEAVKFVLKKLNIGFKVVSRKLHDDADLTYENLDEAIVSDHLLIINTTPLGTFPNVDECPAIPYQFLTHQHYLFDLVYNPAKTLFLQKGAGHGATIKNGADMLEIQAEESWKIWNDNNY